MSQSMDGLFTFLQKAVSPYHAVHEGIQMLKEQGFQELRIHETWSLKPDTSYAAAVFGSALVAFRIGTRPRQSLRFAAAHTDFPCLRIKPNPSVLARGYGKVNVEVYGGMIRSTWLDRPLSRAGKVIVKGNHEDMDVRLVDIRRPVMTIPHLAIHMDRTVNKGESLNPQKDMLPILTTMDGTNISEAFFMDFLSAELQIEKEQLLSYDLIVYPTAPPCRLGWHNEFISASRLDNMTSVYACLQGILQGENKDGIQCIALFDHEEVGSRTKQGAASFMLPNILQRIYLNLGYTMEDYFADMAKGFLLSLDVAHAMHPNAAEKNDITNFPVLNGGVTFKVACSQSYASDAEAVAMAKMLCEARQIPYQVFVNRSDMPGGATLGSLLTANMPVRAMDAGAPILAMHSARELMGADDEESLIQLVVSLFS